MSSSQNYIREGSAETEPKGLYDWIEQDAITGLNIKADDEEETTPIKKEIDLDFAINIYDKRCDKNKLDEEIGEWWLIDLKGEIEDMINDRIRKKLGDSLNGYIVINHTAY
tara:strand:+ start:47 stop:379 length:333 start_codon:yes stop_codon:yes gene_type:complete